MSEELRLQFRVDKEGLAEIDKLQGKLERVNKEAKPGLWGAVGERVKGATAAMRSGFDAALAPAVALTAAFMGIRSALAGVQDGARDLALDAAFESLSGGADKAAASMDRLRSASNFQVEQTQLTSMANKWIMAGKDLDELVRVLPMAEKLAAATNQEITAVAEQLVQGLKLGKERILEPYAGVVDASAAYEAYARSIGKATNKLTEQEKVTARSEQAMRQLSNVVAGVRLSPDATAAKQALAEWDDLWSDVKAVAAKGAVGVKRQVDLALSGPGVLIAELEHGRKLVAQRQEAARLAREEREERKLGHATQEAINILMAPFVSLQEQAVDGAQRWYQAQVDALDARGKLSKEIEAAYTGMERFYKLSGEQLALQSQGLGNLNVLEQARLKMLDDQLAVLVEQGVVAEDMAIQLRGMAAIDELKKIGAGTVEAIGRWLREAPKAKAAKAPVRSGGGGIGKAADVVPEGIEAGDLLSLDALRADRNERARIQAEYAAEMDAIAADYAARRIDEDKRLLKEASAYEIQRQRLRDLDEQTADANRAAAELARDEANRIAALSDEYAVLSGQMGKYQAAWNEINRMPTETAADREAQAIARKTQAWMEQADAIEKNQEALQKLAEMQSSSMAGIGEGIESAIGWAQTADADLIPERMAKATGALGELSKAMGQVHAATNPSELAAGFQGMITGFGSFAVALGAEIGPVAAIMAAMSVANAAFAAASYNYPQAFSYGASALAYGVVAGMAFGGGRGASGQKAVARSLGTAAPAGAGGGGNNTYNIFLTGREIIKGTSEGIGVGIIEAVNAAKFSGAKFAPQVM